jgi:RND family efflux transporter MFP subunit
VRVETLADPLPGVVQYVAPRVNATSRTVDVRVRIENADERLRPGQTAEITIVTESVPAAVLVPSEAVVTSARGAAVYVAAADGTAELRPVKTGDRRAAKVEIREGLAPGDRVVVEGLARLRPKAAIVEKTDAAPAAGAPSAGAPSAGAPAAAGAPR